jgi:hypothetical protein
MLEQIFDAVLKGMSTASGLGLIGLMLVRTRPRGGFRIIGFEHGPVFDPQLAPAGRRIAWGFMICVGLLMLRTFVAVA